MFAGKNSKKVLEEMTNSSTIVAKGTVLKGNMETYGNIRIEGKVVGNVKSKSKTVLGDSSIVEGNILSQNAEISGEVKGIIEVSDLLILKATAVVYGDIIANKIIVESGASFNGSCKMGAVIKDIVIEEKEELDKERTA